MSVKVEDFYGKPIYHGSSSSNQLTPNNIAPLNRTRGRTPIPGFYGDLDEEVAKTYRQEPNMLGGPSEMPAGSRFYKIDTKFDSPSRIAHIYDEAPDDMIQFMRNTLPESGRVYSDLDGGQALNDKMYGSNFKFREKFDEILEDIAKGNASTKATINDIYMATSRMHDWYPSMSPEQYESMGVSRRAMGSVEFRRYGIDGLIWEEGGGTIGLLDPSDSVTYVDGTKVGRLNIDKLTDISTSQASQTPHLWDEVYDEFERLGGTKETLTSAPTLSKEAIHATPLSPGGAGWASEEEYLKWRYDADGGPLARFKEGGPLHGFKKYKEAWEQVYEDSLPPKIPTSLDDISSLDDIFTPTPVAQAAAASSVPPATGSAANAAAPASSAATIGTPATKISTSTAQAQAQAQASSNTQATSSTQRQTTQARVSSTPAASAVTAPSAGSTGAPVRGTQSLLKAGRGLSASVASGTKGYGNLKVLGAGLLVGIGAQKIASNQRENSRQRIDY
jgi:hypothetical protein